MIFFQGERTLLNEDKRKKFKRNRKGFTLETILSVGSGTATDIAKNSITSVVGDILVDTAGSLIPGVSGAVQNYKRNRFERNMTIFSVYLYTKLEDIRVNLEHKSDEQIEKIDQLFHYVMDYVIDEQQEDKIEYMVNGFVNITEHEQVSDDFILTKVLPIYSGDADLAINKGHIIDNDNPALLESVIQSTEMISNTTVSS